MPKTKNGKPVSHRFDRLPLLASASGGVQQELVVLICRCKGIGFLASVKGGNENFTLLSSRSDQSSTFKETLLVIPVAAELAGGS